MAPKRYPDHREYSVCCRAPVYLSEMRSQGAPPRWDQQSRGAGPPAERDEAVLFCTGCRKTWTRPSKLVIRDDGSCFHDF